LELKVMHGMLENRDICRRAYNLLQEKELDSFEIGNLLNRHHYFLDKHLNISTPMIDRMIFASLEAGALGAKINGSGGGGCMFAYAPNCPEKVAAAIENEGGKAYIIQMGNGADFTFI
jgi:galactokinase